MSGVLHGPALQAGSLYVYGDLLVGASARSRLPEPHQLPADLAGFTGRLKELARLNQFLASKPSDGNKLIVLDGTGGIGKTALASHWLHQIRRSFGGGELYEDLGPNQPEGPASPGQVLGRFLRAVGTAPEQVPADDSERLALWRSLTDGRRLIILLDNPSSAEQVSPLLPGPGPSLIVVTSQVALAGLVAIGARPISLRPMEEADAIALLDRIAGPGRATSDPAAARSLVRRCGYVPQVIGAIAANLAVHPDWSIARAETELARERPIRTALTVSGDNSAYAAIDASYQELGPQAARMYRLAALIPGPDFGPDLAAAATATAQHRVHDLLDVLTQSSLLERAGDGRFRCHDQVRMHAREQVACEKDAREQQAVVAASVRWYLRKAVAADLAVIPGRWRLGPTYRLERPLVFPTGTAEALKWLESELLNLSAAVHAAHEQGLHNETWQLCEALWGLFACRKRFDVWVDVHRLGIASAQACADPRAEARMRVQLGLAHLQLGQLVDAEHESVRALALDRHQGHRIGEATALEQLGLVSLARGHTSAAMSRFRQAQAILREVECSRGFAMMTCHIGETHLDAGRFDMAIEHLRKARSQTAVVPDTYNKARALTGLGQALVAVGQHTDAAKSLHRAMAIMTDLGAPYEQARIRVALAHASRQAGDPGRANAQFRKARAIYNELGVPYLARPRMRLSSWAP